MDTIISTNYEENDFLFYDVEIFKHDAIVVFMDSDENIVAEYHLCPENKDQLPFLEIPYLIEGKVLVGYNNYHYDDYILTLMMGNYPDNKTLKTCNDCIIQGESTYIHEIDRRILSLDAWQQISVARSGLKKLEANMGLDIRETPIDFDREEPLTPEELEQVTQYCRHDVSCTVKVFKMRWQGYFVPKLEILKLLPEYKQQRALRWNTTSITQHILTGGEKIAPNIPKGGYIDFSKYPFMSDEVIQMWTDENRTTKKVLVEDCDTEFEFAFGGLHGVPINDTGHYHNVKLLDVASMYPNLLIKLNGLEKSTDVYKGIVKERLKIKHEDPVKSGALKLIINSTYGLLRPEYSKIYNPDGADAVCFMGQIILYDLCKRLYEGGYNLINVNTDGVAFSGQGDNYKKIWHEWEADYNLELELSEFKEWIQRDVNCYIAVYKSGKVKVKGGDVKKYHDTADFKAVFDGKIGVVGDSWCNTNTCGIVAKAVVDYLLYGTDIYDTLFGNLDKPILYQFVLQAGSTFKGNIDGEGNTDYQRLNRVFAVKKRFAGTPIYKFKEEKTEDNEIIIRKSKYPNAPEHMLLINDDLNSEGLDRAYFKKILDMNYYYDLCRRSLDLFTMGKKGKTMAEQIELIESLENDVQEGLEARM